MAFVFCSPNRSKEVKIKKEKPFYFLFLGALENKIKAINTAEQRRQFYINYSLTDQENTWFSLEQHTRQQNSM